MLDPLMPPPMTITSAVFFTCLVYSGGRREPQDDLRDEDFFFGILAPDLRASLNAIATACLRLRTFLPLPDRSVPCLCSCITFSTFPRPFEFLALLLLRELRVFELLDRVLLDRLLLARLLLDRLVLRELCERFSAMYIPPNV